MYQSHENFPISVIVILVILCILFPIGLTVVSWWDTRSQRKEQEKYRRAEVAEKALSKRDTITYKRPPAPPAIATKNKLIP